MALPRVLLTGFEPFGGEPLNPSERLARELAARPPAGLPLELHAEVLPVALARVGGALRGALDRCRPDAVVALGQATGRARVEVELLARNALDTKGEADNTGHVGRGEPLVPDGPAELRVGLDLQPVCAALAAEGLPLGVSTDAGRHLCNALLYELLLRHAALPALFVHVPLLPEQAARRARGEASLPLERSRDCLLALLGRLPALLASRR